VGPMQRASLERLSSVWEKRRWRKMPKKNGDIRWNKCSSEETFNT
jgi:hypothetical protein